MDKKEYVEKINKGNAMAKLLNLIQICPHIIPASIGIEAYLKLLDEGAELIIKRGDVQQFPTD